MRHQLGKQVALFCLPFAKLHLSFYLEESLPLAEILHLSEKERNKEKEEKKGGKSYQLNTPEVFMKRAILDFCWPTLRRYVPAVLTSDPFKRV